MNKKLIGSLVIIACGAFGAASLHADDAVPLYHPVTVGGEVGLTGFGGSGSWRFMDNLGVRGGIDYFRYSRNETIKDVSYNATVRLMSEPITLDVYPWKARSFHISLGVAVNQNHITGHNNSGTFTINGNTYAGTLNLDIKQQPVDPYLSIGGNFFYFDNAHHWAMGGELGAFYTGKPKVSLTSSNPAAAADVASEQSKIVDYANKLKFWPVAKIGFSFSF